jgi:hypothetical protein
VTVRETRDDVVLATGGLVVRIRRGDTRWLELEQAGKRLEGPEQYVTVAEGRLADDRPVRTSSNRLLMMRPPQFVKVEDRGPLRARVRVEGWLVDTEESPVLRYRCRVDVRAGSADVGLVHTFTHLSPRRLLLIEDYRLRFRHEGSGGTAFGVGGRALPGQPGARLEQLSAHRCTLRAAGESADGPRADGWIAFGEANEALVAVRHFAENFPKALTREDDGVSVHLWTGPEPFDADQGLAKTHELLLSLAAPEGRRAETLAHLREPLFGVAPADWYCAARAFGVLAPHSLARFPQYETQVEAAADLMARSRPLGMRHFGDNYFGGPHKGVHAYQNLEYDVAYNHFLQFARTGARKYLDAGLVQARHQGDIDLKHDDGPQWKHSPRHTTTEAELGHVFLRGLVASTWLTGDPEGLENARVLGRWILGLAANPRAQGNERQIGWALYALTGIYEATWEPRYLESMRAMVDRLLAGQDALGRFSIRYDNRIAFFYGVTLSGLAQYHAVTGDARVPEAVRRIVGRLHGFYPDYAGRTLEGLAWHYARTGDPEARLTAQRAWESTLAWRSLDIGGSTLLTTRFLPSVAMLGLAPPAEWRIPETGPVEDGLRRQHFRAPGGVFHLRPLPPARGVDLVLLRHAGTGSAGVRVTAGGREVAARALPATGDALQYLRLSLAGPGPFRLELQSTGTRAWDVLTESATQRVFEPEGWAHLEALTPRVHLPVEAGAREVRLTLSAQGEGFKGAVLADEAGRPVAALAEFVPFGDERPHRYTLRATVPPGAGGRLWSLDLQNTSVAAADGLAPRAATNPRAYW